MHWRLKIFIFCIMTLNNVIVSTSVSAFLDVNLIGEGFHRTLEYRISVDSLNRSNCFIALHLVLPPAIYVNVDEVADLKRVGKTLACSVGEIDVELFAEKAGSQNVTVCDQLRSSENVLSLPVHQRYKFSQENGGRADIQIPNPKLLVGCKVKLKDHRVSKIDLCSPCVDLALKWRELPYRTKSENKVWQIPVGNLSHLKLVSYVTLLVTTLGAVAVLQALIKLQKRSESGMKED